MKISRDINGNKILVIEGSDIGCKKGFSIQTNGNLIRTHKMTNDTLNQDIAFSESVEWVRKYGTKSQREKMGV